MDPRTGEIIKGHVSLGSLRVRQDYLLAEGLLAPYKTGDEQPPELAAMALAAEIARFEERPYEPARRVPELLIPPGSPIGDRAADGWN